MLRRCFKEGKISAETYKAIIGDLKESKTITRKESKKAIEKLPEPKVEKEKKPLPAKHAKKLEKHAKKRPDIIKKPFKVKKK